MKQTALPCPSPIIFKDRTIQTKLPSYVMGVINLTTDSFWEKSRTVECEKAVEAVLRMESEGADIVDIGAESSRPGAQYVSAENEIERLVPVVEGIRKYSQIAISIDTRKKSVMHMAHNAGAQMLNDISALEDDPTLASFCAETQIPVILMHKRGNSAIMQQNTTYGNIVSEVCTYLRERAAYARKEGILPEHIWLDPGIGFAKDADGNATLVRQLRTLCDEGYPVLAALSRKSLIGFITNRSTDMRLSGTLCAHLIAVMNGASMVRVHDVSETVDMLRVLQALT